MRSPGTGSDSSQTPVLAVGNRPYNGHNPPKYLDAEFNQLQVLDSNSRWQDVRNGATVTVTADTPIKVRASVGNIQEATWLAPAGAGSKAGAVYLSAALGSGLSFRQPIRSDTPYLADADLGEFTMPPVVHGQTQVVLQMTAAGRAWFGEKRNLTFVPR